jgi:nudix-type nucleoside diphosphatase (YffH/AdpP family)
MLLGDACRRRIGWGSNSMQVEARSKRGVRMYRRELLLDHFFVRVSEVQVSYRLPGEVWSRPVARVVVDRGMSVAALIFDPPSKVFHFVRQFRFPTYDFENEARDGNGWTIELVAGRKGPSEDPQAAMVREIQEEAGLTVQSIRQIGKFFLSPGASNEELLLFYAEAHARTQTKRVPRGDIDEEYVESVSFSADAFLDAVSNGAVADAKTICAAEWLRRNRHILSNA